MFKLFGVLLALHVVRCVVRGDVYGRSGLWSRSWGRDDYALGLWISVSAYSALVLMLSFLV